GQEADIIAMSSQALAELDRTLLAASGQSEGAPNEDLQMLSTVRTKLSMKVSDIDALKAKALELWENYKNQNGFTLAVRKLMDAALTRDKGTTYNDAYTYCVECIATIKGAGIEPSADFYEAMLHLYYRWRVIRSIPTANLDNQ